MTKQSIPLFYWSEIRFIDRDRENYGDLLSKYLVEKISGRSVKFVHPKKQAWYKLEKKNFLAIGSILHHATRDSIIWGSGIIDKQKKVPNADFRAVRGPRTRNFLLDLGYKCPEVYGDPAILLPKLYKPAVDKRFGLGIIPHYTDFKRAKDLFQDQPQIKVIDLLTLDLESVTREILSCEKTISSSLHGIIVSQAYNIPSLWVEFSNKIFGDGIKYIDYLESLEMPVYKPEFIDEQTDINRILKLMEEKSFLPEPDKLEKLQNGLLSNCPFIDQSVN